MRKIFLFMSLFALTTKIYAQTYNYLGTFNSQGVPNYLMPTNDIIPANFLEHVSASLPEYYPVPTYHPQYLSTGTATNIYMQGNGHVWVTFVDEGAGYKNVLGYYSYPESTPPTSIPSKNNLKIIFPNVSKVNSGGGLVPGNKVYLGYFTAGTVISWFLIADGYRNNAVTDGNWRLFSNQNFNPESNASLRFHNVLLYDTTYDKIILGFEDIRRDNGACDNDFNDAIFYVTSTPDTAISKNGMNKATNPTPEITSGNEGGLESNGSLAGAISQRYFARQQETSADKKEYQIEMASLSFKAGDLNKFIPTLDAVGLTSYLSSPTDLIKITNATDVLSVDYYDTLGKRQGVMLATETDNKVYNHTKSICDRLKNASLLNIETKEISGNEFITYTLKQNTGEIEYVTCFSLSDEGNKFTLFNQWLISQYPAKSKYYNFQVWSNMPHINQKLVESIIEKASSSQTLEFDASAKNMPSVYFNKGVVNQNKITFEINNLTSETNAELVFNYTHSEQDQRTAMTFPVVLNANGTTNVTVPFDGLFDADIQLVMNGTTTDEMYLADGAWGITYPETTTDIKNFTIEQTNHSTLNNEYLIPRSAKVNAEITEYITLYKMLKPSNLAVDLTDYQYLNLEISGTDNATIRLNKKSIDVWNKQAKCNLVLNASSQKVSIPLSLFKNELGETLTANDLTSVAFTVATNNNSKKISAIEVNKLSFSKQANYTEYKPSLDMSVYPNPIILKNDFTLNFNASEVSKAIVTIYAMNGSKVYSKQIETVKGYNQVICNIENKIQTGVYILEINQNNKSERKTINIE